MSELSPAMLSRLALKMPAEFDTRQRTILIYIERATGRFVKVVLPQMRVVNAVTLQRIHRRAAAQAHYLWLEKYGTPFPETGVDGDWTEFVLADEIPHEGPTRLTEAEWAHVQRASRQAALTVDILWLLVEGLGWRPGQPVSDDDRGWLSVWAEEEESPGVMESVRELLCLPRRYDWTPIAVIRAYTTRPRSTWRAIAAA